MSASTYTNPSTAAIVARMENQRAQLHRQFVDEPKAAALRTAAATSLAPTAAMQPHQPRSLVMRLLMANPQLMQRLVVLVATTALGARYSSWALRLAGLFLASRKR